jgi:putative acetyltransferase
MDAFGAWCTMEIRKLDFEIRNETEIEQRQVEEITRQAFWNLYAPGCDEHYLVHKLRSDPDFIKELDLVLSIDRKIVANIMYTRSILAADNGEKLNTLTFGPVSVLPEYQRQGLGSQLIEYSLRRAKELGWKVVVIYGNPGNYVKFGFKSCKRYNITNRDRIFPTALLVKEIEEGAIGAGPWQFVESEIYRVNADEAKEYDKNFRPMKKEVRPTQEEFYILSNSIIT